MFVFEIKKKYIAIWVVNGEIENQLAIENFEKLII